MPGLLEAIRFALTVPDCKLDDLWTGFEVAERYRIGNVTEVNFQDAVGQGGLF